MTYTERERQPNTTTHDSIPAETGKNDGDRTSGDCISRTLAIDALRGYLVEKRCPDDGTLTCRLIENEVINKLPSVQPERLTDDDFETIRVHLNAYKEKLCNQKRWEEAEEYQRIIDRFMAFASAQPERKTGHWIPCPQNASWLYVYKCSECGGYLQISDVDGKGYKANYCSYCGAKMEGGEADE